MIRSTTKVQVHIYCFDPDSSVPVFLVLRRPEDRGGWWQPVTGNVDPGEHLGACAAREVWEETGISEISELNDVDTYTFEKEGAQISETVFGAAVKGRDVTLSEEHLEYQWLPYEEARALLHWPGNQAGLDKVFNKIKDQP